jgi:cell pole-organizing protein PopZ
VEDDGSILDVAPTALPEEKPVFVEPPPVAKPVVPSPVNGADLVSEPSALASASALSALASTLEIERLASAPQGTGTPFGNGARTLEDMVIELMRPLLKQWLDQNLPATVDRLVQKEIERIARRAKD